MGKKTIDLNTCTTEEYREYIREITSKDYGHSGYSTNEDTVMGIITIWLFSGLVFFGIVMLVLNK